MKASAKWWTGLGAATAAAAVAAAFLIERHPVGNASVPEPAKSVDLQR
jgi:cobalamin biosynthesis protein CbiD